MFSSRNILILLIVLGIIGIITFFIFGPNRNIAIVIPVPTTTSAPDIATILESDSPKIETSKVHSPDGEMRLFMEKSTSEGISDYTFSVSDEKATNKKNVFTKSLPQNSSMELSQNAWSPDNKYFFITEKSGNSINYLVFRADGEYFSENEQYISVAPLFVARDTGYSFSEITGWDSETLLHVYSTKAGGVKGPSYWFEVPSKAIIQLASR